MKGLLDSKREPKKDKEYPGSRNNAGNARITRLKGQGNRLATARNSAPEYLPLDVSHSQSHLGPRGRWIKGEANLYRKREWEREGTDGVVLHRVLYPNAHENGFKKKKKKTNICMWSKIGRERD